MVVLAVNGPGERTDGRSAASYWARWPAIGGTAAAGALVAAVAIGAAEASDQNKSQYTLFNPTPDRLLRDLTTDRPDITESPFTVDAGRVQVETNLFGYTRSRPDVEGTVTDSYDFLITNVRIGLTYNVRGQRRVPALRDRAHAGRSIR